jgi:hypothetical protein
MYKKYGIALFNEDTAIKNSGFILQLEQSLFEVEKSIRIRKGTGKRNKRIFFHFDILL